MIRRLSHLCILEQVTKCYYDLNMLISDLDSMADFFFLYWVFISVRELSLVVHGLP